MRMSAIDEEIWSPSAQQAKIPPDMADLPFSKFVTSGAPAFPEVVGPIYDEVNEKYGTDLQPFFKE